MKLLETYKPRYGSWISMNHPTKKDKELTYWNEGSYKIPTLSVYPRDFKESYELSRIRKEAYETT